MDVARVSEKNSDPQAPCAGLGESQCWKQGCWTTEPEGVHVDSGAAASSRLSGTPLAPEPCSFPGIAPAHLPPLSVRSPKGGSLSRVNSGEKRLSQKKKGKDLVILTICGI